MSLETKLNSEQKIFTVMLPEKFDFEIHRAFRDIRHEADLPGLTYRIDFSKTTFMDSSALGMLLLMREELGGEDSKIELFNIRSEVKDLLELARFNDLFTIC